MSNDCSPEAANRVVTLYTTTHGKAGSAAAAGPRATVRRGVSRAALYFAHVNAPPQELRQQPVPDRSETSFWSSALDFLAEGFANCGTPLHPVAYFNAGGSPIETEIPMREPFAANARGRVLSLVPSAARRANDGNASANVLAMASRTFLDVPYRGPSNRGPWSRGLADRAPTSPVALPQEIERLAPWNWLRSCWETVVSLHAHMRREREIRKAMDALAELDDFTLKDIGIHHRGQIEYAVRNSDHDC